VRYVAASPRGLGVSFVLVSCIEHSRINNELSIVVRLYVRQRITYMVKSFFEVPSFLSRRIVIVDPLFGKGENESNVVSQ